MAGPLKKISKAITKGASNLKQAVTPGPKKPAPIADMRRKGTLPKGGIKNNMPKAPARKR